MSNIPSALPNNRFRVIPVYDDQRSSLFTDLIKPIDQILGTVQFKTAILAINKPVDLIAISMNADLLEAGIYTQTDRIYPDIELKALYLRTSSGIYREQVEDAYFMPTDTSYILEVKYTCTYSTRNAIVRGEVDTDTGCMIVVSEDMSIIGYEILAYRGSAKDVDNYPKFKLLTDHYCYIP